MRVGARLQRHVDQLAVNAVRPAVIRAGEGAGVTAVGVTHAHRAVATLVEKRFDAAVLLAHHHHGVFAHIGVKEIARFGDLAFVGQKQPAASEDAFQLQLVNVRVGINSWGYATVLGINQLVDV